MADSPAARERRLIHIESLKKKPDERLLTARGQRRFCLLFRHSPDCEGKSQRRPGDVPPRTAPALSRMARFSQYPGRAGSHRDREFNLVRKPERSNLELSQAYDATIDGWSHALDLRDKETEGHTLRVTEMTLKLARAFGLPEEELMHVRWGALLHDIGKMGVPDHILLKAGALTGGMGTNEAASQYATICSRRSLLTPALDIPYCHHEKWDGTGYPRGLKARKSRWLPVFLRWWMCGMRFAQTAPIAPPGRWKEPGSIFVNRLGFIYPRSGNIFEYDKRRIVLVQNKVKRTPCKVALAACPVARGN